MGLTAVLSTPEARAEMFEGNIWLASLLAACAGLGAGWVIFGRRTRVQVANPPEQTAPDVNLRNLATVVAEARAKGRAEASAKAETSIRDLSARLARAKADLAHKEERLQAARIELEALRGEIAFCAPPGAKLAHAPVVPLQFGPLEAEGKMALRETVE
ncbi:MAG: hypothetical protein ACJA1E_000588 [Paracoccaceae bacterium]|jgi:hypothetical protein